MENVLENRNQITHSQDIKDLVSALSKAQSVMRPAVFNRVNPHFKNRYADFTSCMEACREPLSDNGLAIIQYCETIDEKLRLVTMLAHVSGQWIKSEFPLIAAKMDSQGIGSAMTYAKRYSLCGMVGIVADEEGDDDGEAAAGRYKDENIKSSEKNRTKLLELFIPEDRDLILEYIKVVMNNFHWSEEETINKFLEEKSIVEKFNNWKSKRK